MTRTFKALIMCIICFSDEDNEIVVRITVQVGGFKPQLCVTLFGVIPLSFISSATGWAKLEVNLTGLQWARPYTKPRAWEHFKRVSCCDHQQRLPISQSSDCASPPHFLIAQLVGTRLCTRLGLQGWKDLVPALVKLKIYRGLRH